MLTQAHAARRWELLASTPVVTVDDAISRASTQPEEAEATIAAAHLDDYHYRWMARWRTTPAFASWHRECAAALIRNGSAHVGHPSHVEDLPARLLK